MTTDLPAPAAPAPSAPRRRVDLSGVRWRRLALENLAVLVVFAAVGLGAGWLWAELFDPPVGVVQDQQWFYVDYDTIGRVFSGTALYAVIGVLAGLVLGVVAALVCRVSEMVTLVAVATGSVLAAYLAHQVGLARSPGNPYLLALVVPDGTELDGALRVSGNSPFVVWTIGSLIGLAVTYFLTAGVSAGVAEAERVDLSRPTHGG